MDYLRKATALYMRGKISNEEYIRRIKENPDRPDYEKIAEARWAHRRGNNGLVALVNKLRHALAHGF